MASMNQVSPKSSVPFWCSIRVAIIFIGFFGIITHFSQKTNLSIGLVCMVNHSAIEHHRSNATITAIVTPDDQCPQTNRTNTIEGSFVWSKNTQGIILGAHYWGYIVTQIPAGYFAGRFGARFIFGGAIFISSLVTIFMPLAANVHWVVFCALQIIVGLAHGSIWPSMTVIAAHWTPINERGKLMGFLGAGAQIGNVLALSIGGLMCSWSFAGGWPLIFYSTSAIGLIWSTVWTFFYTNSPRSHPYITTEEKEFILQNTQQYLSNDNKHNFHAPWKAILTSRACWGLFIVHTCTNYGFYTFLTSIPKYMREVLKFDVKSNGLLSAAPFIFLWVNINFSGFLADIIIRKKILSITNTRKLFTVLGNVLPTIFIIALAFMTCHMKYTAVVLLTIGMTCCGFCLGGGFPLVANDIAPAYAGIVSGISNTFATVPGIVSPYVVGALTEQDPSNWRFVFFICAAIYIVGMIAFLLIGSSELQPWAVKHTDIGNVHVNLLSKENGDQFVKLTSKA